MSTERDGVLAANRAFYQAFAERDADAMDALWSELEPVTCIHPGWAALHGREAVMASWRAILTGDSPVIECSQQSVWVLGELAVVVCVESARGSVAQLAATNVFQRSPAGWRMVHHQAGLIAHSQAPEPPVKRIVN